MLGVVYSRVDANTRVNNEKWKREFQEWIDEQEIPNDDPPLVFETEISGIHRKIALEQLVQMSGRGSTSPRDCGSWCRQGLSAFPLACL